MLISNYHGYTQLGKLMSLKQCVETAITNNLDIKQKGILMDNAAINLKQANDNRLPDLNASINHGLSQGRSIDPFTNGYIDQNIFYGNYNLTSGFTLYSGSQLRNLAKQATLDHEAGKMDLQRSKDDITLSILLAYLQLLSNQDQLVQSINQVELTRKQVERLEVLDKEGSIIPAQLYELRGQLANDELAVVTNRAAVESARLSLTQLMNVPYDKELQVERLTADQYASTYKADPEEIYQLAVAQLAEIKAAELRKQSAQKAIDVQRGGSMPVISLNAGLFSNFSNAAKQDILVNTVQVASGDYVTVNGSQLPVITSKSNYSSKNITYFNQVTNNYSTGLSLYVRIPLLNSFRTKNRVALARNELKNTGYIEETAKVQLRQRIEQGYVNMTSAYDRYFLLLTQVTNFEQAFRSAEVRYNAGVSTQIDYLIAKNNVDRAKINLINARYDYVFRIKILDYYQGKLIL